MTKLLPPAVPSNVPAGFQEAICYACSAAILVDANTHESPICVACQRSNASNDAHRLLLDVKRLVKGEEPFDILTPAERAEQLLQLVGEAADGIADRLPAAAPSPEEREQIESDDAAQKWDAEHGEDPERWDGLS